MFRSIFRLHSVEDLYIQITPSMREEVAGSRG